MSSEELIPALIFVTLGIVLVVGVIQLLSILRKRRERQNTPLTQHSESLRRSGEGTVDRP